MFRSPRPNPKESPGLGPAREHMAVVVAALNDPGFQQKLAAVDRWLAAHPP